MIHVKPIIKWSGIRSWVKQSFYFPRYAAEVRGSEDHLTVCAGDRANVRLAGPHCTAVGGGSASIDVGAKGIAVAGLSGAATAYHQGIAVARGGDATVGEHGVAVTMPGGRAVAGDWGVAATTFSPGNDGRAENYLFVGCGGVAVGSAYTTFRGGHGALFVVRYGARLYVATVGEDGIEAGQLYSFSVVAPHFRLYDAIEAALANQ